MLYLYIYIYKCKKTYLKTSSILEEISFPLVFFFLSAQFLMEKDVY